MGLNLYEINEFNKEIKKYKDSLNNEDNKKILEYAQNRKQELNEELKEINVKQIQNDGNLTAQEWSKKDFLEKEINKHEETISKIETENEANKKIILEKNLQKEDINRQLNLQEAQIEIELADIQKIYNEAITELNSNNEQIRQLRLANRELAEDSKEAQNNLNEILKLQAKNEDLKEVMNENVITSKKGMEVKRKQEEIKAMKNILKSGYVFENLEKVDAEEKSHTQNETEQIETQEGTEEIENETNKTDKTAENNKTVVETEKTVNKSKINKNDVSKFKINSIVVEPIKGGLGYTVIDDKTRKETPGVFMEMKYDEETKQNFNELLKNIKPELDWESVSNSIDPNIISLIAKHSGKNVNDTLTQYFKTLNGRKSELDVSYNLKDIYNSELDLKQIKQLMKIAKSAKKDSKGAVNVEMDSLLKRAFGNMKKRISELDKKLLESQDKRKQEKLENNVKSAEETSEKSKETTKKRFKGPKILKNSENYKQKLSNFANKGKNLKNNIANKFAEKIEKSSIKDKTDFVPKVKVNEQEAIKKVNENNDLDKTTSKEKSEEEINL